MIFAFIKYRFKKNYNEVFVCCSHYFFELNVHILLDIIDQ